MPTYFFHLDQKITVWERTTIQIISENKEEALEKARSIYNYVEKSGPLPDEGPEVDYSFDKLEETIERMSVEDNDGQSTLELLWHNPKLPIIAQNGKSNE